VRVHEAREIASGASGRNGGFALRGLAASYDAARAELGAERAVALWRLTEATVDRMQDLAGDAFRRRGSLRLAADEGEADLLRQEYDALRADGLGAEWLTELEQPLRDRFVAALFHPRDGAIRPARWVRRLAAHAAAAGAEFREHDPVTDVEALGADAVVVATDGYTHGLIEQLDGAVRPTRGQVIATEPLGQDLYDRPHYTYDGFRYWRQTDDGRLVLGGFRDLALDDEWTREEAITPTIQDALAEFGRELIGREPPITHRRSGIFGSTTDLLPLVGRVPGYEDVWASVGYSGHGNVLGLACGRLVAEAIMGKPSPELELFDPRRVLEAAG
jgi:gamma-glutamylputrescine oxidase